MSSILQIAVVLILLLVAQELLRRANRWLMWSLFLVLPVVLTPWWLQRNDFGLFVWIKCYSLFFCVTWGTVVRHTTLRTQRWACATIPLLLAANIIEAVCVDLLEARWPHLLNAFAGLLLLVRLPYGWRRTRVTSHSPRDLLCGTSLGWVVGYTLWNATFVYLNYPSYMGYHTAVLLAALIVAVHQPQRWVQTRASTLGFNLFCMATINNEMVAWLDTSHWFDEGLSLVFAASVAGYMLAYVVRNVPIPFLRQPHRVATVACER